MPTFPDMIGTSAAELQIEKNGVRLQNSGGNLVLSNAGNTANAQLTILTLNNAGNSIILNSDAAGSGSDYSLTLARPSSGMSANYTWTFPTDAGIAGYILSTDGAGNTSWIPVGSTADKLSIDQTALAFGSAATVSMFTLGATAIIDEIRTTILTPFNTAASMSVGIVGNTSKYVPATKVNLQAAAGTVFFATPGLGAAGSSENLIITYSAASASAGSARIDVKYAVPT